MPHKHFLGQPRAFYLIFFIEIWERFGFYGVQALLVLFMVQHLNYKDTHADALFAAFSALAFLFPVLGGYVGDHLIGTKRTILLGAIVLALGYLLLSLPFFSNQYLTLPLAVIAVGNGLFKANPSSLLSKVYQRTKINQDGGFTLYYMAINVGSFLSFIVTPVLNEYFGWHVAFFACFVGLLVAIINYFLMGGLIANVGSHPDFRPLQWRKLNWVILGSLILVGISFWLLDHETIMTWLLVIGAVAFLMLFLSQILKASSAERKGMLLFLILFLQAIVFFVMYFQMPTSINLFALRNVEHVLVGIPIQTANFQALNPFWILVMSPILAVLYNKLSARGKDLSMPSKFALGTLLAGMAFLILPLGAYFARDTGVVNSAWVIASFWCQSTGELLVSALGLSLASKFVPQRLMGYSMGLWWLAASLASVIAGHIASIAAIPKDISHDPRVSLPIYSHLFLEIGIVTVTIAIVMFCFVPALKRLIAEPMGPVSG